MSATVAGRQLDATLVPIDSLKPYRNNARVGDLDAIRESLRANGQYRPIVVWRQENEILAGNHTWKSAKLEDWTEIWATFIDCDAETAERINLVDNRAPELGGYNEELLLKQLGSLPNLEGTGWSLDAMEELANQVTGVGPVLDSSGTAVPDEVPDDDYRAQLGVIVTCLDQGQQQQVYEAVRELLQGRESFYGAELRVVAV